MCVGVFVCVCVTSAEPLLPAGRWRVGPAGGIGDGVLASWRAPPQACWARFCATHPTGGQYLSLECERYAHATLGYMTERQIKLARSFRNGKSYLYFLSPLRGGWILPGGSRLQEVACYRAPTLSLASPQSPWVANGQEEGRQKGKRKGTRVPLHAGGACTIQCGSQRHCGDAVGSAVHGAWCQGWQLVPQMARWFDLACDAGANKGQRPGRHGDIRLPSAARVGARAASP